MPQLMLQQTWPTLQVLRPHSTLSAAGGAAGAVTGAMPPAPPRAARALPLAPPLGTPLRRSAVGMTTPVSPLPPAPPPPTAAVGTGPAPFTATLIGAGGACTT